MSRLLYDHKWMNLCEDAHGEAFVTMGDAVVVVALKDRSVLFVREKSIAYQTDMLTLPMGGVDVDESRAIAANRELQEETGYRAKSMVHVVTLHPSIKYLHWKCHVYLAQGLVVSHLQGDEMSPVQAKLIPLREINRLITTGQLSDSTSIAALFLAGQRLKARARVN